MIVDCRVKGHHVCRFPVITRSIEVEPPVLRQKLNNSASLATARYTEYRNKGAIVLFDHAEYRPGRKIP